MMTNDEFLERVKKIATFSCQLRSEMELFQEEYEKYYVEGSFEEIEEFSCQVDDSISAVEELEDYAFSLTEDLI